MRDLIVSLLLLGLLPTCFRKPFVGLLVFSLLAYMRLQDLTWGFAREVRWSFYVAIVTFAGYYASNREQRFMLPDVRNVIMILMIALIGISIVKAGGPTKDDIPGFTEYVKIIVMALFTTGMLTSRDRLRALVWVIALSFAFYGLKGGVAGILSGGSAEILQGPGGMLRDNNDFALALSMGIPMMWHLAGSERRTILRRVMLAAVPLTMITIGLTHSRGGFLALATAIGCLIWRSRNRVAALTAGVLIVLAGFLAAPQDYRDRIWSITEYKADSSAQARIAAWRTAGRMIAANPVFGVGFARFEPNYGRYDPAREDVTLQQHGVHVAHNSYLQIWAECGTPTFLLYLALILFSFLDVWKVRATARSRYHASWILSYCNMFEASMLTFLIGSTFLNRAHFDLLYHWVAIILAFGVIARRELADPYRYPARTGGRGRLEPVRRPGFGGGAGRAGFRRRPLLGGGT